MQMQEGIGRGGYRWLATVFVAVGVLGLVTTLYAFKSGDARGGLFDWLGFGLSLVALLVLYWMFLALVQPRPATAAAPPAPQPPAQPMRTFEVQVEEEVGEEVAVPVQPERPLVTLPPNRNVGRDARGWPARTGPSGLTRGEWMAQQKASRQPEPSAPVAFTARPNPSRAPYGRGPALSAQETGAPIVIARVADPKDDPDWTPDGMARGKCGGCGVLLYAPPERPIRLRCPKCDKETVLR